MWPLFLDVAPSSASSTLATRPADVYVVPFGIWASPVFGECIPPGLATDGPPPRLVISALRSRALGRFLVPCAFVCVRFHLRPLVGQGRNHSPDAGGHIRRLSCSSLSPPLLPPHPAPAPLFSFLCFYLGPARPLPFRSCYARGPATYHSGVSGATCYEAAK